MTLLPYHAFLYPALVAFILYGARYLLFSGFAYFVTSTARSKPWGKAHSTPPAGFSFSPHIRRELSHSLKSIAIFALINGSLVGFGVLHYSQFYTDINQYPLGWFFLSIVLMLLLHDSFFYWSHRLMHTQRLFLVAHRLHHLSIYPTAFTAYSFNTLEIIIEASLVISMLFILPIHPLAFLIFQTFSIAYNVYGHCGREFYPASITNHWLGKWLNTSTLHAHHHRYGRGNYSLYFTFWDRLMGTLVTTAPALRQRHPT